MDIVRDTYDGELNIIGWEEYIRPFHDHKPTKAQIADAERKAKVQRQVREWKNHKRQQAIRSAVGTIIFIGLFFGFPAVLYFI